MTAPGPDRPGEPRLERLLRWYPRAWRERYGGELLAMVEDTLDGRRPGWRLRLGVARAGLLERAHQGRRAALRAWPRVLRSLTIARWRVFMAGYVLARFPETLRESPPPARAAQVIAALGVLIAVIAIAGAAVLAGALAALPAFARFVRAGGWPQIRHRFWRAAAATAVAAGALAELVLVSRAHTYDQLGSWSGYVGWVTVTGLTLAVALGLWIAAATATARHLDLSPAVRAAEKRLGAAIAPAAWAMLSAVIVFDAAAQSSVPLLLFGLSCFAAQGSGEYVRRRLARG